MNCPRSSRNEHKLIAYSIYFIAPFFPFFLFTAKSSDYWRVCIPPLCFCGKMLLALCEIWSPLKGIVLISHVHEVNLWKSPRWKVQMEGVQQLRKFVFTSVARGVKTDLSCEIASGLFINDRNASALTRALSIPLQICMGISTTKKTGRKGESE